MNPRRVAGAYAVVVGVAMVGLWVGLLATGGVPEVETAPAEIGFHLAAEFVTAVALLVTAAGAVSGRRWASAGLPVALGMLLYTTINSPGYYAGRGEVASVGLFVSLAVVTAFVAVLVVRSSALSAGRRLDVNRTGGEDPR